MSWIGKSLPVVCPHCAKNFDINYRGQLSYAQTATAEIQIKKKRDFRPPYRTLLECSAVGDTWLIAPNRIAWFTWASGPWLRRHPHASLQEEKQEDGNVRFTRTS